MAASARLVRRGPFPAECPLNLLAGVLCKEYTRAKRHPDWHDHRQGWPHAGALSSGRCPANSCAGSACLRVAWSACDSVSLAYDRMKTARWSAWLRKRAASAASKRHRKRATHGLARNGA